MIRTSQRLAAGVWMLCLCLAVAQRGAAADVAPLDLDPGKHSARCAGCSAEAVWAGFLEHLHAISRSDLIPDDQLPVENPLDLEARGELQIALVRTDPIKGVLFKMSPELLELDAMVQEAGASPYSPETLAKVKDLSRKLIDKEDVYLKAYGVLHLGRAQTESGEAAQAVPALEGLVKSCFFLPRREARKALAGAYAALGDDTLATLELQYFLLDLPPQDETQTAWAEGELKRIRDAGKPGPLRHSEDTMREVSTLISGREVRDPAQKGQRRVEDILEKVAKLLEAKGGACSSGELCPQVFAPELQEMEGQMEGMVQVEGQRPGRKPGNQPGNRPGQGQPRNKGQQKQKGKPKSNDPRGEGAEDSELDQQEPADVALRDATPEEKEAWGKINDREVARTLKEVWDKIPQSYRLMVTQYFKELSDPQAPAKPNGQ